MKRKMKIELKTAKNQEKGITLIVLIVTIIVLIILAGVTINIAFGENGLFNIAKGAVEKQKRAEIEELANISYMTRKAEEYVGGVEVTLAGIISDLKAAGQDIKEIKQGEATVKGIELSKSSIEMPINTNTTIACTISYNEAGTVKYYVGIKGKYYEITLGKDGVVIGKEEIDVKGKEEIKAEITVSANNSKVTVSMDKDIVNIASGAEAGEAILTVEDKQSGEKAICVVTVTIPIESISLNKTTLTLNKGTSEKLVASITPENVTEEIIWDSINKNIATVDEEGLVIGIEAGSTTITATNEAGTITATCELTVVIPAEGISLNESSITLAPNETKQLIATVTPEGTTDTVSWDIDKKEIAEVKNGLVTAKQEGTATVTVTCGELTAYCTVNVGVPATGVTLNKTEIEVGKGSTETLVATPTPENTTDAITWDIEPKSIATIDEEGTVTGIAVGEATVTVTCGVYTATCTVTVTGVPDGWIGIYNETDLKNVANDLTAKYMVMKDITITGTNWTPLGTGENKAFEGTLEGNGHTISNLKINKTTNNTGLFGYANGATIKNLTLNNCNMQVQGYFIGMLVGYADNTTIEKVYAEGSITLTGNSGNVGGVVGYCESGTNMVMVDKCYTGGTITYSGSTSYGGNVGGLVGYANAYGGGSPRISNSFSSMNVRCNNKVGGLIGILGLCSLSNSYAIGSVAAATGYKGRTYRG